MPSYRIAVLLALLALLPVLLAACGGGHGGGYQNPTALFGSIASVEAKRLEHVALFSTLSKKEREQLARWTDEVTVAEGEELATQGKFAHEFFVIEDGAAAVRKDGETIGELGPGDFFGEIGLLETDRRTATVVATTPLTVIVMGQREFSTMERDMPAVADRIRAAIRARLSEQ